ncbi:hypothetical protein HPP92_022794 [Vanilla planifolia]|uniref:Uncharacterized protein n=1 Tax=Vanilla planifolia TaxID=51239 RepID=A0A835PVD9_VANPL|nr:hypothetical protein HPP92_023095 [Vanilla planifolia]KAG0459666.1 hypothetical protein HPP92_022794 [Vanilla planifolia]
MNLSCLIPCSVQRPGGDLVTAAQSAMQVLTQKGNEAMNKAKETVKQKGRAVTQQACSAIITAEQTAGDISSSIISSSCISKGASWLSAALDRASKSVAELGGVKAQSPNFFKQK